MAARGAGQAGPHLHQDWSVACLLLVLLLVLLPLPLLTCCQPVMIAAAVVLLGCAAAAAAPACLVCMQAAVHVLAADATALGSLYSNNPSPFPPCRPAVLHARGRAVPGVHQGAGEAAGGLFTYHHLLGWPQWPLDKALAVPGRKLGLLHAAACARWPTGLLTHADPAPSCCAPPNQQDNVPPFESETAIGIIESSLGAPVSQACAAGLPQSAVWWPVQTRQAVKLWQPVQRWQPGGPLQLQLQAARCFAAEQWATLHRWLANWHVAAAPCTASCAFVHCTAHAHCCLAHPFARSCLRSLSRSRLRRPAWAKCMWPRCGADSMHAVGRCTTVAAGWFAACHSAADLLEASACRGTGSDIAHACGCVPGADIGQKLVVKVLAINLLQHCQSSAVLSYHTNRVLSCPPRRSRARRWWSRCSGRA